MKKWVAALRSGEFKQGEGYLNNKGTHCCLGILCELALIEGKVPGYRDKSRITNYGDDELVFLLPYEVKRWSGVWDSFGANRKTGKTLSDMNDNGVPFKEIADIIEQNYKEL